MTSSATPSPTPKPAATPPTAPPPQVILQSTRDNELQPDALRGSEHLVKDLLASGDLVDLEAERADRIDPQKKGA